MIWYYDKEFDNYWDENNIEMLIVNFVQEILNIKHKPEAIVLSVHETGVPVRLETSEWSSIFVLIFARDFIHAMRWYSLEKIGVKRSNKSCNLLFKEVTNV